MTEENLREKVSGPALLFPELGIGPDIGGLSFMELMALWQFLARIAGEQ